MKECEYFERLISDSMDDLLDADSKAELIEHLLDCKRCREFEETLLAHRQLLRDLPEPTPAERHPIRMGDYSIARKSRPLWKRRISVPLPVAAVLSVVMLAGWLFAFGGSSAEKSDELQRATSSRAVEIIRLAPKSAVKIDNVKSDSLNSRRVI
jgi:anti-sigma factor RsiW